MITFVAFVVAIALLVAIHEWGHFQMARACGVKVLRFSVGFGPALFKWTSPKSGTEYALAVLPLGGYVKMLDEREGPVAPEQRGMAFNTQPLRKRAAIVAAGPLANLVLAVLLYCVVNWMGVMEPEARLSQPPSGSIAALAGFSGGERIHKVGFEPDAMVDVASFEDLRWWVTRAALGAKDLRVAYVPASRQSELETVLPLGGFQTEHADATMFRAIGIMAPFSTARVGDIRPESAAFEAGLLAGDLVRRVDQTDIVDAGQLRELIRLSGRDKAPNVQKWVVQRGEALQTIEVTPKREFDAGVAVGRVGAIIGERPVMVQVRSGPLDGLTKSLVRTWEVSALTLQMMGQMLTGQASIKNLSGPITIADYAGRSASMGFTAYLVFLALISISLGVLNLLPLPVLDGGHLMYYLWEALTGREVSESWMSGLQRAGLAILMMMMSVAVFNDIHRLLS